MNHASHKVPFGNPNTANAARMIIRRSVEVSRWLFGPLALIFLAVAGWSVRETYVSIVAQAQLRLLILAISIWLFVHLMAPVCTWLLLRGGSWC